MNNNSPKFSEQLEIYNNSIQNSNLKPDIKALFQELGELIHCMNYTQYINNKKILSEITSLKDQVNNIQTSIDSNASLSKDTKDRIDKLNTTLSPALDIIDNRKEILTDEELIEMLDNKGFTAEKVAELYNMKAGTVRQRHRRYKIKNKQVDMYKNLGKGLLDNSKILTDKNIKLFADSAGCSIEDMEAFIDGRNTKNTNTNKTS